MTTITRTHGVLQDFMTDQERRKYRHAITQGRHHAHVTRFYAHNGFRLSTIKQYRRARVCFETAANIRRGMEVYREMLESTGARVVG